jgi:hypothetical protein
MMLVGFGGRALFAARRRRKGARHKVTFLAEALLDGQARGLMQQAVSMALAATRQHCASA